MTHITTDFLHGHRMVSHIPLYLHMSCIIMDRGLRHFSGLRVPPSLSHPCWQQSRRLPSLATTPWITKRGDISTYNTWCRGHLGLGSARARTKSRRLETLTSTITPSLRWVRGACWSRDDPLHGHLWVHGNCFVWAGFHGRSVPTLPPLLRFRVWATLNASLALWCPLDGLLQPHTWCHRV